MRLRTPGLPHGGTGTLDGELDQASVLAVRVDGMTGEEDRVPAVSWFQLRTFQGEKRSPFRLSYPEHRAPPFPYCSLLRELCLRREVTLQSPSPQLRSASKICPLRHPWCCRTPSRSQPLVQAAEI